MKEIKVKKRINKKEMENGNIFISTDQGNWFAEKKGDGFTLKHIHKKKCGKKGPAGAFNQKIGAYHAHKKVYKNLGEVEKYIKFHDYRFLSKKSKSIHGRFLRGEDISSLAPEWKIH